MPDFLLVLILILIVVIIWRGPKTLPLIGRAFGQGVKEARHEIDSIKAESASGGTGGSAESAESAASATTAQRTTNDPPPSS
jgi:Sec-independent protein translocase protein TatA